MKRFKFLVIALVLFSSNGLFPEIIDIKFIKDILPYVDKETFVVFDIDHTLITPKQMLGADRWFQSAYLNFISEGYTNEESNAKLLPIHMDIQNKTEVIPVEGVTPSLIHSLQQQGNVVMGLTSRGAELAFKTIEQLASVDIHFNKNPPKCQKLGVSSHFPLSYIEGILFASHNNKGKFLFALARELNFEIQKICFVDDKLIYLQQMEKMCEQHRVPFIGFRYGGCDETSQNFDPDVARVQMKYLGRILTNEDAEKILEEKNKESS